MTVSQMTPKEIGASLAKDVLDQHGAGASGPAMSEALTAACLPNFASEPDAILKQAIAVATNILDEARQSWREAQTRPPAREAGPDGTWMDLHCDAAPASPMGLRRVEPISLTGLDIDQPENGEPICEHVDPATLFVDPTYQRDIGDRGLRQIRRIVEAWDWNRYKPPICAYSVHDGQTVLKVLDGQHTAIAAASHPAIHLIPCMIVDASETSSQAAAFVGQNTERLGVTPLQLHKAAVTALDDDALTVKQVCDRAGVSVLQYSVKSFDVGQTVAIGAIKKLVVERGAMKARIILETLTKGGMAPILAPQIKAVEALICEPEYRDEVKLEDIYSVVQQATFKADNGDAKIFAATHNVPLWRALAVIWFQKAKKRRKPVVRVAA